MGTYYVLERARMGLSETYFAIQISENYKMYDPDKLEADIRNNKRRPNTIKRIIIENNLSKSEFKDLMSKILSN